MAYKQVVDNASWFPFSFQYVKYSKIFQKSLAEWKTNGIPTIRSDLPAPRIRRIGDSTVNLTASLCLFNPTINARNPEII